MKRGTALSIILFMLCVIVAGYLFSGIKGVVWGSVIGIALVVACIIVIAIYLHIHTNYNRLDAHPVNQDKHGNAHVPHYLTDSNAGFALKASVSDLRQRNRKQYITRPLLTDGGLTIESASHIKRFICYRTPEQTLIFVRLRAGKLYCMYMNRVKKSNGTRWVVRKIEGEEYGAISEKLKSMAQAINY